MAPPTPTAQQTSAPMQTAMPAEPTSAVETPAMTALPEASPAQSAAAPAAGSDAVLALAQKSGCMACHDIDKKRVGPSWKDVGKRYKGQADARKQLVASVKNGSKDKWKDVTGGVAMPANSPRVSDPDIEKLVDYILAL